MNDATGISVTGGTGTVYEDDGLEVRNGIHVVDTTEADFLDRKHITLRNRPYSLQSDGSYSKGVRSIVVTMPHELADGTRSFGVVRLSFELHPELTAAQINELRRLAAQVANDAETDNFFLYGSTK
jgi:hypothetical protein